MRDMKQIASLALVLTLTAAPVTSQDTSDTDKSLMEQGAELFFKGLREEMEPTLDSLRGLAEEYGPSMRSFVEEMGPALADMASQVQDWSAYHAPEMLENGDIIIRKKVTPEGEAPIDPSPEDEPPSGATDI